MKKKRSKKTGTIGATTTSWDWGFGPAPCKGGKTQNSWIGEGMIHREMKDQRKK